MKCEMCDWTATLMVWVRSNKSQRIHAEAFCSVECKRTGLEALADAGFEEARGITGRDIFIPMSYKGT